MTATAIGWIGSTTSRYRHLAPIGRGGMAEVLLSLMDVGGGGQKVVVLKRIWPDLATDPDFVAMFHDEAQLAIHLNHPNIVQTLEVVESVGELAIAMEYLHGQPLTAVMNHHLTGPNQLSLALRLRVLADILAGLHHAHELRDYNGNPLGVVHRDVSPHNVFVTYDGQVKLMDFGVAKSVAAGYRTRPGAIKGKLAYLAPEYFRSDVIDRRADVFAVGVMLWELLSGRRLWQGLSEPQIVHHLAAAAELPPLPADAIRPPALDAICARALALDPNDRYPTAAALEVDLQHVLVGSADSHARTLGRVVSYAFGAARTEREALIARALDAGRPAAPAPERPAHLRLAEGPDGTRKVSWTAEVDAFVSTGADPDVTVVDPPVVSEAPARSAPPRRGRWAAGALAAVVLTGVVLSLAAFEWQRGIRAYLAPASPPPPSAIRDDDTPLPSAEPAAAPAASAAAFGRAAVPEAPARRTVAEEPSHWRKPLGRRGARRSQLKNDGHGDTRLDSQLFEEPANEKRRPASVRRIDESDPF